MRLRITLLVLFIIVTLAAVQSGLAARFTQASELSAVAVTATPESSTGEYEHDAAPAAEDTTSMAMVMSEQEQIFQVTVATYLMDTAGFHDMDDRINQEGTIEAGDAGVVNRVIGVLNATAWPETLQAQVDPLKDTLSKYAEALANDDIEAAKPLATQTHELQHDLSHSAATWLAEMTGSVQPGVDEHSQSN